MWSVLKAIFSYFSARKRRWLLPIVLFLFILGALIVVSATSVFAPFIYTLF
ncbi:MAG: DUF5989 family protein [bacterium]|nr:DUF5989 family protein [bacterium]